MSFLLGTDIRIHWLKGNRGIQGRVHDIGTGQLAISVITVAELYFGAFHSARPADNTTKWKF
jgi:tRNA(fMet)-specific endonuclease VapC